MGVSGPYQWVDLDGEGLSGILSEQAGGWFYKANLGQARFAPGEVVALKPALAALNSGQHLSWEKVRFDPWHQESWDVNDTVLVADPDVGDFFRRLPAEDYLPTWHQARSTGGLGGQERDAAQKAAAHANTPAVVHFDALGRAFLSIADNGPAGRHETRTEQDIEGNPLRIVDDRGNLVMAYQLADGAGQPVPGYDVAGRQLYERSMDAGEQRALPDIGGRPIRSWDSRGYSVRSTFDALRRPRQLVVRQGNGPELLAELTIYGEEHPDAENLKLRGRVYHVYDGAGVATSTRFDFKGNPRESRRQLARTYRTTPDWSSLFSKRAQSRAMCAVRCRLHLRPHLAKEGR